MLEAETLLVTARKISGISDFGEAPLEGLSRYCRLAQREHHGDGWRDGSRSAED